MKTNNVSLFRFTQNGVLQASSATAKMHNGGCIFHAASSSNVTLAAIFFPRAQLA